MTNAVAAYDRRPIKTVGTKSSKGKVRPIELEGPVTIIESFHIPSAGGRAWREQWNEILALAEQFPGCRRFQLLRDRKDRKRYSVLTEWESMESYNRFRLQTGVVWIERFRPAAFHPVRSSSFDLI